MVNNQLNSLIDYLGKNILHKNYLNPTILTWRSWMYNFTPIGDIVPGPPLWQQAPVKDKQGKRILSRAH